MNFEDIRDIRDGDTVKARFDFDGTGEFIVEGQVRRGHVGSHTLIYAQEILEHTPAPQHPVWVWARVIKIESLGFTRYAVRNTDGSGWLHENDTDVTTTKELMRWEDSGAIITVVVGDE